MNVYLDTAVVLDLLSGIQPYGSDAEQVFRLIADRKVTGFVSAAAYQQLGAVLEGAMPPAAARARLRDLQQLLEAVPMDDKLITAALYSETAGFAESLQLACALRVRNAHALITRNTKAFRNKDIRILTPKEFINDFNN